MKDLQGKAVGAFWVETKQAENEFGNAVIMLVVSRAPEQGLVPERMGSSLAYSLAAFIERETDTSDEWSVHVERRIGRWYVQLQLCDGSPSEAKRAKAMAVKAMRAA